MRVNTVKRLLREGMPAIGTWLTFGSVGVAEALATAGLDWLVVDLEHNPISIETLAVMFTAMDHTPTIPMCRVPWNDPAAIKRALDAGALGIVVPMVNSAEEAAAAVRAARFPPLGVRSAGGGRWRYWADHDYYRHANEEVLVVVQIEHIDAVRRADEILSIPGVDVGFIGPNDLAWSMGLLPDGPGPDAPEHAAAVAEVVAAGRRTGKPIGIYAWSAEDVVRRLHQGVQMISCRHDAAILLETMTADLQIIRAGLPMKAT